jgi:RNA polymerase sigma-70 factor (ECF subfamily)
MSENLSMQRMDQSDATLLSAARSGNADALEQLLHRHQEQVFRFGMKMCGNREDARDVLQDSMLAVARSIRGFRAESSLSTWLYSIARSFCIKKRRQRKFPATEQSLDTGVSTADVSTLKDPGRLPDEVVASRQVREALENAMQTLDPLLREVLVLRDVEGLTAREVSQVLGVRVEAVKSRLHRARASLRDQVAPLLGIGPGPNAVNKGCPDIVRVFSRYLEGDIDADTCAAMERHLDDCPACRSVCHSLKETLTLCKSGVEVPTDVQDSIKQAILAFVNSASSN